MNGLDAMAVIMNISEEAEYKNIPLKRFMQNLREKKPKNNLQDAPSVEFHFAKFIVPFKIIFLIG